MKAPAPLVLTDRLARLVATIAQQQTNGWCDDITLGQAIPLDADEIDADLETLIDYGIVTFHVVSIECRDVLMYNIVEPQLHARRDANSRPVGHRIMTRKADRS